MSFVVSAFADEMVGATAKSPRNIYAQAAVASALGLKFVDLRFADFGDGQGNINIMKWNDGQRALARDLFQSYGINVSCIGSPVGKCVFMSNMFDQNKYSAEVESACKIAKFFNCRFIRIFGFYPCDFKKDETISEADRTEMFKRVIDYIAELVQLAEEYYVVFCLELETGLFGQTGAEIAQICSQINSPHLCGLFDAANSYVRTRSTEGTYQDWLDMKEFQGPILHEKDFKAPTDWQWDGRNEDVLNHFCPIGYGDSGYDKILPDYLAVSSKIEQEYGRFGITKPIVTLEPHVKGGGQFGGFSGPDGMFVALSAHNELMSELDLQSSNIEIAKHSFPSWNKIQSEKISS